MNGRVYDPVLGRFLSADPFIDSSTDGQSFNRYSYLNNDPLGGVDPSGYFKLRDVLKIAAVVAVGVITAGSALYAISPMLGAAGTSYASLSAAIGAMTSGSLTLSGAIIAGAGAGFGSGFAGSLLNGGSIGDAFKTGAVGAAVGGISAGLAHGIGTMAQNGDWGWGLRAAVHGAAQGGVTEAIGGEFRHGFYAGFFSSAAGSFGVIERVDQIGGDVGEVAAAAVVGGTASAIGGGKFANGAVSGAFIHLFNDKSHRNSSPAVRLEEQLSEKEAGALTNAGVPKANMEAVRRSNLPVQRHHMVPHSNSKFHYENHDLIKAAKVDLKSDPRNILDVAGHGGRHPDSMHYQVTRYLDNAWSAVQAGRWTPQRALDAVWRSIQSDISTGKLRLYETKSVYIPNK